MEKAGATAGIPRRSDQNPVISVQSILTPEGYQALARRAFRDVEATAYHNLLRMPYTHIIMRSSTPLQRQG